MGCQCLTPPEGTGRLDSMRRSFISLLGAAGELVRYFGLIALARAFLGGAAGKTSLALLQFAATPHLLFAGGFLYLWLDPRKYDAFRPLLAAGKALGFLTLGILLARFALGSRVELPPQGDPAALLSAMGAFLAWDAAAGLALVRSLRAHPLDSGSPRSETPCTLPEPVELE